MAVLRTNTAEGGTSGALVTTDNSGAASGDAFNVVQQNISVITYVATPVAEGVRAIKVSSSAGSNVGYVAWTGLGINDTVYCYALIRRTAQPATGLAWVSGKTLAGAELFRGVWATDGYLQVRGTASTTWTTDRVLMPLDAWVLIELSAKASATDGWVRCRRWGPGNLSGSGTPVEDSGQITTTTGSNVDRVEFGNTQANNSGSTFLDNLRVANAAALGGNTPPVATYSPPQSAPANSPVTLTVVGTDADGTITAYEHEQTAGPTVTLSGSATATASFTPISGGVYTFRARVQDNSGAWSAWATTTVTVLVAVPFAAAGAWTPVGGSALAVLGDNNDATYVESPNPPSSSTPEDLTLPALEPPSGDLVVLARMSTGSGNATVTGTLRDGTTTVATASAVTVTNTIAGYTITFPSASLTGLAASKWTAGGMVVRLVAVPA